MSNGHVVRHVVAPGTFVDDNLRSTKTNGKYAIYNLIVTFSKRRGKKIGKKN